jgi:hypothetical protein
MWVKALLLLPLLPVPMPPQAKSTVQRTRVELLAANRRGPDEPIRWITASRSQPTDEAAAMVAGGCAPRGAAWFPFHHIGYFIA